MSQYGDSPDSLEAARRALAARDAELAAADLDLALALDDAHALALESIGRLDAIDAELDATDTRPPRDSPAAAHELSRHLIAKNRDIADVVRDAQAAATAKAVGLRELTDRYR
jgi:hypothetical protein